jgi:hypothetical protein
VKAFPPVIGDLTAWAQRLTQTLQQGWSQLEAKQAGASAAQDGVLLWDRSLAVPVVSTAGAFVPLLTGNLSETIDDRVAALLVAGTNITLTYNDGAGTLTIDATGGGSDPLLAWFL